MSLKIDISNYEAYVIDYLEGTLTPDERAAFEAFKLTNPELALEIEEMAEIGVELEPEVNALNLYHVKLQVTPVLGINEHNYEEAFALSGSEEFPKLEAFVAENPFLAKDFKLYQAVKLTPTAHKFEGKSTLKKPIPLWEQTQVFALRAAAAVALIFGLMSVWQLTGDSSYNPRSAGVEFANMGEINSSDATTMMQQIDHDGHEAVESPQVEEVYREVIALMPVVPAEQKAKEPAIDSRTDEWVAYIAPEEVEDLTTAHQTASELSVAQFIGKQFLGVDPNEAPTTKDVLKQGAKKVIASNDQLAVNTSVDYDNKKTVEILAGLFEYRRVTYAAN